MSCYFIFNMSNAGRVKHKFGYQSVIKRRTRYFLSLSRDDQGLKTRADGIQTERKKSVSSRNIRHISTGAVGSLAPRLLEIIETCME